jgi:hypothetical protein
MKMAGAWSSAATPGVAFSLKPAATATASPVALSLRTSGVGALTVFRTCTTLPSVTISRGASATQSLVISILQVSAAHSVETVEASPGVAFGLASGAYHDGIVSSSFSGRLRGGGPPHPSLSLLKTPSSSCNGL